MSENNINTSNFLAFARQVIIEEFGKHGVDVKRIIHFGSRFRGDARSDSDWDFLVVTGTELQFNQKWDIIEAIHARSFRAGISVDLAVCSMAQWEQDQNDVGAISYYAEHDGVPI
jgi:uncharacterized protein